MVKIWSLTLRREAGADHVVTPALSVARQRFPAQVPGQRRKDAVSSENRAGHVRDRLMVVVERGAHQGQVG